MIKLISLSRDEQKGVETIEATFQYDGDLKPLRVSDNDRPEIYDEIQDLINSPNTDLLEVAEELFNLMSPEAKVNKQIKSSYHLSDNLRITNGQIIFGEFVLEETLANHMLSLLDEDELPKDERLWASYIKFLDNLHQNVNEDIRKQLFRWMDYENKSGANFAITEDGCFVGYKGCQGTILEPESVFTGKAIVDGVDFEGHIPNKVGSVIRMPRATVQNDPTVGCSQGLHVGTRDYATQWAPILLLVKVNPRDVVSVPYECDSQKIRVCEYTVLKVTDASEEHKMFHYNEDEWEDVENYEEDYEDYGEDYVLDPEDALSLLGSEVYVEYDGGDSAFEGLVVNVHETGEPGIVIKNADGEYKHIKLYRISYYNLVVEDEDEEYDDEIDWDEDDCEYLLSLEEAKKYLNCEIYVEYDGGDSSFEGIVVSIHETGEPGIVIKNADGEYKHIKLYRIDGYYVEEPELQDDEYVELQLGEELQLGDIVEVEYRPDDSKEIIMYKGHIINIDMSYGQILIHDYKTGLAILNSGEILSISQLPTT